MNVPIGQNLGTTDTTKLGNSQNAHQLQLEQRLNEAVVSSPEVSNINTAGMDAQTMEVLLRRIAADLVSTKAELAALKNQAPPEMAVGQQVPEVAPERVSPEDQKRKEIALKIVKNQLMPKLSMLEDFKGFSHKKLFEKTEKAFLDIKALVPTSSLERDVLNRAIRDAGLDYMDGAISLQNFASGTRDLDFLLQTQGMDESTRLSSYTKERLAPMKGKRGKSFFFKGPYERFNLNADLALRTLKGMLPRNHMAAKALERGFSAANSCFEADAKQAVYMETIDTMISMLG